MPHLGHSNAPAAASMDMQPMTKTVLITGCSTGIGRVAARTFQANGWRVAATMRRPEAERELGDLENTFVTALDVTDRSSIDSAIAQTLATFGGIDVLVNNAGYGGHAALEQSSDESVRAMFDTNVFGVFNTTRAVMPMLRKRGGAVINVTSMAGMIGIPLETSYCASKWAIEGFTEALAMECRDLNVKVHSVLPGAYATSFNDNVQDNLDTGDAQVIELTQRLRAHFGAIVAEHHGGERTADPQEVADLIYRCATQEMPVHNPCGTDAEMLVGLSRSPGRQVFYDNLAGLLLPAKQA